MKLITHILILFLFCSTQLRSQNSVGELNNFIPEGYVVFEKVCGDLNKDGLEDCLIITKGTDKSKIVKNRFDEIVDRNRRGLIVLFKTGKGYEKILENYHIFESENEDGGVYFPPELYTYIKNEILYFHYGHGRYGYWKYTFRYQNDDFELIGFDSSSNHGPIVSRQVSINYSTKKKLTRINKAYDSDSDIPIFQELWEKIKIDQLVKLSQIESLNDLSIP